MALERPPWRPTWRADRQTWREEGPTWRAKGVQEALGGQVGQANGRLEARLGAFNPFEALQPETPDRFIRIDYKFIR